MRYIIVFWLCILVAMTAGFAFTADKATRAVVYVIRTDDGAPLAK